MYFNTCLYLLSGKLSLGTLRQRGTRYPRLCGLENFEFMDILSFQYRT